MRGTLVLGIGSPIVSDDAVGLSVAEEIAKRDLEGVEVEQHSTSGLDIIDIVLDFERVVVIDSIVTGRDPPGTVTIHRPEDFDHAVSGGSPHEINLFTAIELGRKLYPGRMPREIVLVAVEVLDVLTISEEMTPEVEGSIHSVAERVLEML
ncbi:MAG: hydrogenase maturation protease [Methanomassiliicoccales archaeon]